MNLLPAARVRNKWNHENGTWGVGRGIHWLEHPLIQQRINTLVSGRANVDHVGYFLQKHLRQRLPVARCLTLGCGAGQLERGLVQYRLTDCHDAVDLAEKSIAAAQDAAAAAGLNHLHYRVADLNRITLPESSYDVVFGVSAVHHVRRLEHLFLEVARALKPGGFFYLDEFVGPTRFRWSDRQLHAVNAALGMLPARLRRRVGDGRLVGRIQRPTAWLFRLRDPSEAVRSADILSLLPRYFDVLEFRGYGGTLLQLLLDGIAGNFNPGDPEAETLLRWCFDFEDRLLQSGYLTHDFCVAIARRAAGPVPREAGTGPTPGQSRWETSPQRTLRQHAQSLRRVLSEL